MKRLMMLFGLLVLIFVPVFSQDLPNVYDTLWELLADGEGVFLNLAGFVGATVFVSAFLNKILKITGNWPKRIVSWVVAGVFVAATNLFNLFLLADATFVQSAAYALGIGLVGNGFFTIPQIVSFLQYLKLEAKKPV